MCSPILVITGAVKLDYLLSVFFIAVGSAENALIVGFYSAPA